MRLGDEAQRGGHRDVGVADAAVEPVVARPTGAIGLEDGENGGYLPAAAVDPEVRHLLVQPFLVKQADGLVGQPGRKAGDLQRPVPGRLGGGNMARSAGTRLSR